MGCSSCGQNRTRNRWRVTWGDGRTQLYDDRSEAVAAMTQANDNKASLKAVPR